MKVLFFRTAKIQKQTQLLLHYILLITKLLHNPILTQQYFNITYIKQDYN